MSCSKPKASDVMLEDDVRREALRLEVLVFRRPSHTCSAGKVADSGVEGSSSSTVGVEQVESGSERAATAAL